MLGQDFGTFIPHPILDMTLRALCLYIFTLEYLEDGAPRFKDITNADNLTLSVNTCLDCRLKREDEQEEEPKKEKDNGSPKVTDFEEKVMKKKNKRAKKRKAQLASFCARVKSMSYPESTLPCLPPKLCSGLSHLGGSWFPRPDDFRSLCLCDFQSLCPGGSRSPRHKGFRLLHPTGFLLHCLGGSWLPRLGNFWLPRPGSWLTFLGRS